MQDVSEQIKQKKPISWLLFSGHTWKHWILILNIVVSFTAVHSLFIKKWVGSNRSTASDVSKNCWAFNQTSTGSLREEQFWYTPSLPYTHSSWNERCLVQNSGECLNPESQVKTKIPVALTQNSNPQRGAATVSISCAMVYAAPYSTRKFWRRFSKHSVDFVVYSHTKVFCSFKCFGLGLLGNLLQKTISLSMLTEINLVIKIK